MPIIGQIDRDYQRHDASQRCMNVASAAWGRWQCTLRLGHQGQHVGHYGDGSVCGIWPQTGDAPVPPASPPPRPACSECGLGPSCRCAVQFFTSPLTFHPAKLHERKRNPSGRMLAVEIEIASIRPPTTVWDVVRKWQGSVVADGSLPRGGFEINTAPAAGDKFVEQVSEICTALNRSDAKVDDRCGLHVHIDARDYDYYTIRRLVNVYAVIEPALYELIPPERRGSFYCKPCGQHYQRTIALGLAPYRTVKRQVIAANYPGQLERDPAEIKTLRADKYYRARYNALNIHSWFHRGTIECRLFNGTSNAHKIRSWGMLWAQILDYVAARTDAEIQHDLCTPSRAFTARSTLLKVAGLPKLQEFCKKRWARFEGRGRIPDSDADAT